MQFRDGRQAEGPIALSEVQGYAYQAAMETAELFDAFGEPGGSGAARLRRGPPAQVPGALLG